MKTITVGHVLAEDTGEPAPRPVVFLHAVNGSGTELLPYDRAEALLQHVTAAPQLTVTGDLATGFAWPTPGAVPRYSQVVVPLAAPAWPDARHPAMVVIELWWPLDEAGYRQVRSFLGFVNDPFDAYLIACCLWSTRSTGGGAQAAFLYGPDRRTAYRITETARTCSQIPTEMIARVVATAADRDTTDPLPDELPRGCARVRQERIDGTLTYTGSASEITEVMREHADARESSFDPIQARALRLAADEFEGGIRQVYQGTSHYRLASVGTGDGH
ncbi:MAG: hypothetical protein AUG49_20330 [Catenulispora sp. 13_1_20CM_3_70_7]|nr:MAG: hypothetical protein AUG49_20330 [Catenulispora sp. 13_1_20CM_3_70_7]